MGTLLGIAGLLAIVWAVRSVGKHPTQEIPRSEDALAPERMPEQSPERHAVASSVPPGAQQAPQQPMRRLTPEERETLAEARRRWAEQRSHDAKMAAAAGIAGVVAGAALAHHHDSVSLQNHIDQATAAQRDALAQTMNYDSGDGYDEGYARGYRSGYDDGYGDGQDQRWDDDAMYGDTSRDDDIYADAYDDAMYDDDSYDDSLDDAYDDDAYDEDSYDDDDDWSICDDFDDGGFDDDSGGFDSDDFDSDDFGGDDFDF